MTKIKQIDSSDDIIDIRDVIARYEEIEAEIEAQNDDAGDTIDPAVRSEFSLLIELMADLRGYGGDEQWRGDWYPVALICNSHFEAYAKQLAEDIGAVDRNATWPHNCIDWEAAANLLQKDYSSVEFDGITFWYLGR